MTHATAVDGNAKSGAVPGARRYLLRVDFSERHAALLDLARNCADFDIQLERLAIGDYVVDRGVVVERKTYADFATSLADGRLFPRRGSERSFAERELYRQSLARAAALCAVQLCGGRLGFRSPPSTSLPRGRGKQTRTECAFHQPGHVHIHVKRSPGERVSC
ncbi:MAG: hypothetical protein HYZ58_19225 [Acidobacteria bacterium]|nr:hypothetical protein [Acidobacteriota bacterium]